SDRAAHPHSAQHCAHDPAPNPPTIPIAAFLRQAAAPRPTCDAALAAAAWADYARVRAAVRAAVPVAARVRHRLLSVPRREG
ncbi:MAG: hypothetical protein HOV87_26840, partial [Catenulispora sp.]|nr:hypothetical protein [Catenulispora sp.]